MEALGKGVGLVRCVLQDSGQIHTEVEKAFRQGLGRDRVTAVGCLAEILDIAAPVEDEEELLIDTLTEDVLTLAGTTANHLPELNLWLNLLEEDQVEDFRHVDTSIQHIHGNGNLRHLCRDTEVVDEVLGICDLIVDQYAEIAAVFRIQVGKALDNELGMLVIVGKDDGLA